MAATGPEAMTPGRLRRRLTIAFVLVAGVSAGVLAGGSYLPLRQARYDASLHAAAADARYQLVLAGQFLPLTEPHRTALLTSFEGSGRHVVLVAGQSWPSHPAYAPPLGEQLRRTVAAGQLGYQRSTGRPRLLVVGGRIPGSTAELYVITGEDDLATELDQLRTALVAGWVLVVLLAAAVGHTLARRTLEPMRRANRARERERRFTADVAHELRTPVTALVAAASLLREHLDWLPADARRAGELLLTDVVRLRGLVEDLMEISRLDAGQESVAVTDVDASALLHAIVAARGWQHRVAVDAEPVRLRTDPRRLERVLGNLIANAVQHGAGAVRAAVARSGERVAFEVSDQGPGIPAEHLPRLFDRFHKVDPARGGSGLGLAIAQENARLLGGRLTVRSTPGTGTRFRLLLPDAPDGADRERD
ncbi:HAMP domain-containing sensor histidine kinase [Micromonospora sp. FIMYZ51]|uniref:sensor histidine kinase n=1 Tax=Micromonospora sp. FIMYZ51 TaxID=3051832 RepID=UPI00311E0E33